MTEYNPNPVAETGTKYSSQTGVKSVVFYSFNDEDALAVIRMLGPAKSTGLEVIRGVNNDRSVNIDAVKKGELVIIQREFAVEYDSYEKIISLARALNKPIVLDLDDLILALPEDHPDRVAGNFTPALLPLLQTIIEADLITVPSTYLREYLLAYNPNIEVIPNYLDDSLWQLRTPIINKDTQRPIIIGYMGGHSHSPDLLMVQPALIQLVEKYSQERIRFQFWGIEPPEELAFYAKVDWFPPPSKRYSDFANYFQQQEVDILIAPLCDNLFNSCKSSIKFLEFSAIGAPGVYSRVTPYAEIIENEKEGLLAATTEEWVSMLSRLIESAELRSRIIGNAQQKISQSWLLSQNIAPRVKIYFDLVKNYRREKKIYPPFFDLEKSLTRQLYEEHLRNYSKQQIINSKIAEKDADILFLKDSEAKQYDLIQSLTSKVSDEDDLIKALNDNITDQDGIIQSQHDQLQEQNRRMVDLENEVLSYVTSRSWRITRPFRKILK